MVTKQNSNNVDWNSRDTQYIEVNGCRLEIRCTTRTSNSEASVTRSPNGMDKIAPESIDAGPPLADVSESEKPVIVLLHEGLGCVELWRQFPDLLCEQTGCRVVAFSRAGYGSSDVVPLPRPLDYMTHEALDVLPLVLDAIGSSRYVLLGHSDGATVAAIHTAYSADYRVRGLILIAPHFFTEAEAVAAIAETRDQYKHGDLRDKLARYHKNVDVAFNGWCEAWLDPDFAEWDVADSIDHWRIPVLAIQGTSDEYGTLAQIEAIKSRIYSPFQERIIPDCGHSPHLRAQADTLASVTGFIEQLIAIETGH